jgi:hypothetical protein
MAPTPLPPPPQPTSPQPTQSPQQQQQQLQTTSSSSSLDYFNFEFVGAGIKLEKSILIMNTHPSNKNITFGNGNSNGVSDTHDHITSATTNDLNTTTIIDEANNNSRRGGVKSTKNGARVNFTDVAETYEYPSYEFLLKEMGIVDSSSSQDEYPSSYETTTADLSSTIPPNQLTTSTTSFTQFLPGRLSSGGDEDEEEEDEDYAESNYNRIGEIAGVYTNGNGSNGHSNGHSNGARRHNGNVIDGRHDEDEDEDDYYENYNSDGMEDKITNGNKFSKLGSLMILISLIFGNVKLYNDAI